MTEDRPRFDLPPPPSHRPGQDGRAVADGPVPWTWHDALGAFALSLLAGFGISLVVFLLSGAPPDAGTGLDITVALIVGQVALAAATLLWVGARFGSTLWRLFGRRRPSWADVPVALGFGLLTYLVINLGLGTVLELVFNALGFEVPPVQEEFRRAVQDPARAPVFVASATLLAPAVEELFFRGLLFQALRDRLGLWWGTGISSALFGLSHLNFGGAALANIAVFCVTAALGVAFAWIFQRRGTLLAAIVVHALVNLTSTVLLLYGVE